MTDTCCSSVAVGGSGCHVRACPSWTLGNIMNTLDKRGRSVHGTGQGGEGEEEGAFCGTWRALSHTEQGTLEEGTGDLGSLLGHSTEHRAVLLGPPNNVGQDNADGAVRHDLEGVVPTVPQPEGDVVCRAEGRRRAPLAPDTSSAGTGQGTRPCNAHQPPMPRIHRPQLHYRLTCHAQQLTKGDVGAGGGDAPPRHAPLHFLHRPFVVTSKHCRQGGDVVQQTLRACVVV